MIPNLSISYRLTAVCIISTAQQANPNVKGQREPERAQAITDISLVEIHSSFIKIKVFANGNSAASGRCTLPDVAYRILNGVFF